MAKSLTDKKFVIGNGYCRLGMAISRMKISQIQELLHSLTSREQKILSMRFGLEDNITHTLEEIGQEFGITRERVNQLEAKALEQLRKVIIKRCQNL